MRTSPPRRRFASAFCSALIFLAVAAPRAAHGSDPIAQDAHRRGWFRAAVGSDGTAARSAFSASGSVVLPAGQSLAPGLGAGSLGVVQVADVVTEIPGRYRFGLELEGCADSAVQLWRAGSADSSRAPSNAQPVAPQPVAPQPVAWNADGWSDWIELEAGERVTFAIAAVRAAERALKLVPRWERDLADDRGFRAEPIPARCVTPSIARLDDRSPPLLRRLSSAGGNELYRPRTTDDVARDSARVRVGELGCLHCHSAGEPTTLAPPSRKGPDLRGIGDRVHASWLAPWIADPQDLKPGSGMPDRFEATPEDDADLGALLHYLLDGSSQAVTNAATEPAVIEQGRRLYHTVGCVACHGALASPAEVFGDDLYPTEVPDADVPAPFRAVHDKWKPGALAAFLKDPRAVWPESPMPSMNLTDEEADLIATYLVANERAEPLGIGLAGENHDALVQRGRAVFTERGCASCHAAPDAAERSYAEPTATPLIGWRMDRGCLDATAADAPRYALDERDRALIREYVASRTGPEVATVPLSEARDTYAALNCQACHARDGQGGLPESLRPYFIGLEESAELGDEARIPPELSGVGRKLTTPWLADVLTHGGRARPYMAARMPQFAPDEVGPLAHGLALLDGVFPNTDREEPAVTDELVLAGKRLMGLRGLACISCHVVGDLPPAGTPGPDMTRFAERLRYDWFRDYMHDPARFKPGTRMPQFTTAGKSAIVDLWDGDAERQIDAMWAYYTLGEFLPVPEGVPKPGELALVPEDRAVVFRTFLESVGSKAICVGTPSGLHYAFDADRVRLAEVWKGDFVDASANWTARGGGEAGGRGPVAWVAPDTSWIGLAPSSSAPPVEARLDFLGYRVGDGGAPTFRYAASAGSLACTVEETVVPYPRADALFGRLFAIAGLPPGSKISIPMAVEHSVATGPPSLPFGDSDVYAGLIANVGASASPLRSGPECRIELVQASEGDPLFTGADQPMFFSIEVSE